MRRIHLFFIPVIFISALFFSCQKVVNINLNKADPKVVIEANLSDQLTSCTVKLSKTVNFDETNSFPSVTGAVVSITDNLGNSTTLSELTAGNYVSPGYTAIPGRIYNLSVNVEGKSYTASCLMPAPVPIDTIYISTNPNRFGTKINKVIHVQFTDPAGIANYYKLVRVINYNASNNIYLSTDRLNDGAKISQNISTGDVGLTTGDTVEVHLQAISKDVYEYFRTLAQQQSGSSLASTAPANPLTNIVGGALGYFSVHAETKKGITVR